MHDVERVNGIAQLFRYTAYAVAVQIVQSDHELFTAITGSHVQRTARETLYHLRHATQRAISRLMTVTVVVCLEVVNVDQQQCQAAMITQGLLPDTGEVLIEGTAILEAGETVSGGHLTHEASLEERRALLPLDAAVHECSYRARDAEYAHVIRDVRGRLPDVGQRCPVREDHQSDRKQGLTEQLSAQEVQDDAVGGQQVELIGMAVDHPARDSHGRCNGKYGQSHACRPQIEALVISAPRRPHEEQARGQNHTQPPRERAAGRHVVEHDQMKGSGCRQKKQRQLEESNASAYALGVEGLEFLLQRRGKAQIREIPPQLRRVG